MGDDTTQVADGGETTETTEATEQTATVDKNSAQYRIQQLVEEKKALQAQLDEANQLSAKQKLEVESNYARQMYGESVDEPSVQEYKTKYPDLTYPQIF